MRYFKLIIYLFVWCSGHHCFASGVPTSVSSEKKIFMFSSHTSFNYILDHHQQITDWPFDGTVAQIYPDQKLDNTHSGVFWSNLHIPTEAYESQIQVARKIKEAGPLTILPRLDVTPGDVDWFDDAAWAVMTEKFVNISRVAKEGGWPGIILDTEQYHLLVFSYWGHDKSGEKTFHEYCKQARLRGNQLSSAVKSFFPDIKIFITFGCWVVADDISNGLQQEKTSYALLPAFLDGLLDGSKELTIIDGYEKSYPYRTYEEFVTGANEIRDAKIFSVDPNRYDHRVQVSFGLWISSLPNPWDQKDFSRNYFTPEEFEHSLSYALQLADEYVWIYCGEALFEKGYIPDAYLEAIQNARKPHATDYNFRSFEIKKQKDRKVSAKKMKSHKDEYAFKRLWAKHLLVADLPKEGWKFKEDPGNIGIEQGWFELNLNDTDWGDIEIGDWWEAFGYLYTGPAWYRRNWQIPQQSKEYEKLFLAFGAVDEDCWVYIDGKLAGSFIHGGPGWNTPFEIDVTEHLTPGKNHTLAVRVLDSSGAGGIWKSVKLIAPK